MAAPVMAQSLGIGDVRVYGHFSPAIVSYGDGADSYTGVADNSYSGGRIGFWLDVPAKHVRTRFNFETSLGLRQSASLSQFLVPPAIDIDAATLRKLEVIYEFGDFGSLSVGQGSMATDSVTESDLSGTQLATYVGISDTAGGYYFRTVSGALSPVSITEAFPTFDGGRAPRIRWDSSEIGLNRFGTFRIAAATGFEITDGRVIVNESLADIGLFYRNRLGDFEVKASAGSSLAQVTDDVAPQAAFSVSLLHAPSGWNFTTASGLREGEGEYIYNKIGLTRRWFDWGDTALSVDSYSGIDTVGSGTRASSYGIGIVQTLDHSNLQLYLGLRRYEYSGAGAVAFRTSESILFGTKWVFKRLDNIRLPSGRSEVDWNESG